MYNLLCIIMFAFIVFLKVLFTYPKVGLFTWNKERCLSQIKVRTNYFICHSVFYFYLGLLLYSIFLLYMQFYFALDDFKFLIHFLLSTAINFCFILIKYCCTWYNWYPSLDIFIMVRIFMKPVRNYLFFMHSYLS